MLILLLNTSGAHQEEVVLKLHIQLYLLVWECVLNGVRDVGSLNIEWNHAEVSELGYLMSLNVFLRD